MKTTHLHIYKSMAERAKRWKGYYWITADDFGAKLVVFRANMFHIREDSMILTFYVPPLAKRQGLCDIDGS